MRVVVRFAALVTGVVAAGAVTAACSSPKPSASTTTKPPRTTTTTTKAPTTTTTAPSTSTTGGTTNCQPSQLKIVEAGSSGAAGTIELTFSLTNTSGTLCTMYGYPGMLLLHGGAPQPTNVVRGGSLSFENIGPSNVSLSPSAVAYFNVGYSDVTTGNTGCSVATSLEVTPPNDTAFAVVPAAGINACDNGTLNTSAVFGSTNTSATQTTAPPS